MADDGDPLRAARIALRAGLVWSRSRAYFPPMSFLTRFSPLRAVRDLRVYLAQREKYELGFFALALGITGIVLFAFLRDANDIKTPYKPTIIYVQQWRADRTDAQIVAQQKIDQVEKDKRIAEQKAEQAKVQAQYKKLDDHLKALGI